MIKVEILADSINTCNERRLTTFLLTYPRFIHSEIMTHRVFSRNSASSRAQPVSKIIKDVLYNPAVPMRWGKNGKGMQDHGVLSPSKQKLAHSFWLLARFPVLAFVYLLLKVGLHKQVSNRLLEPWMWMTVVVTSTEWKNFYKLRYHEDAQPEFRELAGMMLEAHIKSKPKQLGLYEWHIPFIKPEEENLSEEDRLVIGTSRCARTSYVNFYGKNNFKDDKDLHDRLISSGHWSPFEHCCIAVSNDTFYGNLRGWKQYRKSFIFSENYENSGKSLEEIKNEAEKK